MNEDQYFEFQKELDKQLLFKQVKLQQDYFKNREEFIKLPLHEKLLYLFDKLENKDE